jgi:ABC-type molybdate transport system substrate-binding protein
MKNSFFRMSRGKAVLLFAAFLIFCGQSFMFAGAKKASAKTAQILQPVELHLYAGAGLRTPAEIIIKDFESVTGNTVRVEWAGMGQLLTRFQMTNTGDVFLSGAESYVDDIA